MYKATVLCVGLVAASEAMATGDPTPDAEILQVGTFSEDTGDVVRIESAEYLRTYSQEVAAAACFLYNDIDVVLSQELLIESRLGFDKRVDALLNGSEELGIIGGEQRRKTIAKVDDVVATWAPMSAAVDALVANPQDSDAVNVIKNLNLELLEKTEVLVAQIEGQYANPAELMQVDAIKLEIVGRAAMMTQKIAKDACKIFTGNDSVALKDNLGTSMQNYEASINALLHGMPELGLQPAPTPQIAAQLEAVQADWIKVRPILAAALGGETIDRDSQVFLFKHMVEEMLRLSELTDSYVTQSKHIY